jgi:hypothetical protein
VSRSSRSSRSFGLVLFFLGVLSLGSPDALVAQVTGSAGAGMTFQHFGFSDGATTGIESVQLITIPVAARVDLGGGFAVDVSSAWARGALARAGGEDVTLAGATDTRVSLGWSVPGDRVTVAVLGVVPSGATSFTAPEAELAGVVAADLLPFRVSHWGSGGGAGGATTLIHTAGPWGFAGAASFLVPGGYEPVVDPEFEYRPGIQFSLQGAMDRRVGPSSTASLSLAYHHHAEDAVDGENIFRPGNRFQALGSLAFPLGAERIALTYGGYLHRTQGTFLQDLDPRASQGFILLGAGLRQPTSFGTLVPSTDLRVVRREDGVNQGWLLGAGASLEHRAGAVNLTPTLMARVGSVRAREGVSTGVTGIELGMRVGFGGTR